MSTKLNGTAMHRRPLFNRWAALPFLLLMLAGGCGPQGIPEAHNAPAGVKLVKLGAKDAIQLDDGALQRAGITLSPVLASDASQEKLPSGELGPASSQVVSISSRYAGQVVEVTVAPGDRVYRNQRIAYVYDLQLAVAQKAYEIASARRLAAKRELGAKQRQAGVGVHPQMTADEARLAADRAEQTVLKDGEMVEVDKLMLKNVSQGDRRTAAAGKLGQDEADLAAAENADAVAGGSKVAAKGRLSNEEPAGVPKSTARVNAQSLEAQYKSAVGEAQKATQQDDDYKAKMEQDEAEYTRILASSDPAAGLRSRLERDEATYEKDQSAEVDARDQLVRSLDANWSGIGAQRELDIAEATYEEQQKQVEEAESALRTFGVTPGDTFGEIRNGKLEIPILAPMDGVIVGHPAALNQDIEAGGEVAELARIDQLSLAAAVNREQRSQLRSAQSVQLLVAGFSDETFTAKVDRISNSHGIAVLTVDNPDWTLRPGMPACVLTDSSGLPTVIAPRAALSETNGKPCVFVQIAEGTFIEQPVQTKAASGEYVTVSSGLWAGEQIVVGGRTELEDLVRQARAAPAGIR